MICTYDRGRQLTRVVLQDGLVGLAAVLGLWNGGPWGHALATGAAASLAWGLLTLHFPSKVELTADGIAFSGYGRTHAFAWRDVARVRVRRFLVRDRVLVRLTPATAWRGRYWITDGLTGYDALVVELEQRARAAVPQT
jgi:hypothetical protein